MNLASLKQTRQDSSMPAMMDGEDKEYYPCLYLDGKALDALRLENQKPGVEMTMIATVRVSSIRAESDGDRSMEFEVLEAAMKPKEPDRNAANILFPNG